MWTTVLPESHAHWLHVRGTRRPGLHDARMWLRETVCGIRGHDLLLHFESERICLECSTCGHQTPGWRVAAPRRPARLR